MISKYLKKIKEILSVIRLKPVKDSSGERYRRIILSGLTGIGAKGIAILTALLTVPLTLNYLGLERYGLWMTISTTLVLMNFADLGIGNGLVNLISEANGKGDKIAASRYVSSAFFLLLGVAVLLFLLMAVAYSFIPWSRVYNLNTAVAIRDAGPATAVFFVGVVINIPLGIVKRIQLGYQEGVLSNIWTSVGSVLGLLFLLIVIYSKAGLPWLVAAMSGGPIVATLINWCIYFYKKNWLYPRFSLFSWKVSRRVGSIGSLFLILQIAALIGNSSDNIVITHVVGIGAVAGYAITQKLFSFTLVMQYFTTFLWPAFGEAFACRDYVWAKKTLNHTLALSLFLGILTVTPLLLFGKQIINIWVGPDVLPSTFLLLGFVFWALLSGYGGVMSAFLNSGKLLPYQTWFYVLSSVIALALKIFLAGKWQAAGIVWATVFGYGLFYVIPSARLAYSHLNKKIKENEGGGNNAGS